MSRGRGCPILDRGVVPSQLTSGCVSAWSALAATSSARKRSVAGVRYLVDRRTADTRRLGGSVARGLIATPGFRDGTPVRRRRLRDPRAAALARRPLLTRAAGGPLQGSSRSEIPTMGFLICGKWSVPGSNRRPPPCKGGALPAELTPRAAQTSRFGSVGPAAPSRLPPRLWPGRARQGSSVRVRARKPIAPR